MVTQLADKLLCSTHVSSIQATTKRMEQTLLEVLRRLDQSGHQESPTALVAPSLRLRRTLSSASTMLSSLSIRGSVSNNGNDGFTIDASDRILQRYLGQSGSCPPQRASSVDTITGSLVSQIQGVATTPRTLHLGAVYCDLCDVRTSGIYYGCENGHHYVCIVCFSSEVRCPVNDNDRLIKTAPKQDQVVPAPRVSGWQLWLSERYCDACGALCISKSNISYHCLVCRMGDYDICQ